MLNLAAATFNNLLSLGHTPEVALALVVSALKLNLKQANTLRATVGYIY